ncbi:MAG: VOC family protein, partial [Ilumatobacteraceae bacterium]
DMVPNHGGVDFTVESVDASIEAATGAGGQVVNGPMDIPGVGRIATVHDPAGGNFNLMQPAG